MGWDDFHPHLFEVGDREYGPQPGPDEDEDEDSEWRSPSAWAGDDSELTIAQALGDNPNGITYVYDFDENWRVRVTRVGETEIDAAVTVACTDGEQAGPQRESRDLDPFTLDLANRRLRRALRPRASAEYPAGPAASADQQLLAKLTLVVLFLGSQPTKWGTREAWKTVRFEILDSLDEAGLIESDPKRKGLLLTDAGVALAQRLLQRLRTL
jgi:hypothetical protein